MHETSVLIPYMLNYALAIFYTSLYSSKTKLYSLQKMVMLHKVNNVKCLAEQIDRIIAYARLQEYKTWKL